MQEDIYERIKTSMVELLEKQHGWPGSNSKEKCEDCDGNHALDKCPIMIKGNRALKENVKLDGEDSINNVLDDIATLKSWKQDF